MENLSLYWNGAQVVDTGTDIMAPYHSVEVIATHLKTGNDRIWSSNALLHSIPGDKWIPWLTPSKQHFINT